MTTSVSTGTDELIAHLARLLGGQVRVCHDVYDGTARWWIEVDGEQFTPVHDSKNGSMRQAIKQGFARAVELLFDELPAADG